MPLRHHCTSLMSLPRCPRHTCPLQPPLASSSSAGVVSTVDALLLLLLLLRIGAVVAGSGGGSPPRRITHAAAAAHTAVTALSALSYVVLGVLVAFTLWLTVRSLYLSAVPLLLPVTLLTALWHWESGQFSDPTSRRPRTVETCSEKWLCFRLAPTVPPLVGRRYRGPPGAALRARPPRQHLGLRHPP